MKIWKSILTTCLYFLSIAAYPVLLMQHYPYHLDPPTKFTFILVALLVIYYALIGPFHPNKYFNVLYSILAIILILCHQAIKPSFYLLCLFVCQLLLCFLVQKSPTRAIVGNLVLPFFTSAMLIFSLLHFVSAQMILNLLLINVLVVIVHLVKSRGQILLAIVCLSLVILALLGLKQLTLQQSIVFFIGTGSMFFLQKWGRYSRNLAYFSLLRIILVLLLSF